MIGTGFMKWKPMNFSGLSVRVSRSVAASMIRSLEGRGDAGEGGLFVIFGDLVAGHLTGQIAVNFSQCVV